MDSIFKFIRIESTPQDTSNQWINEDIRPLPPHRRTWTRWAYISFWAINQMALSNFQLGASLVAAGLAVWQAVIAIVLGKIIVAAVAVLNGLVHIAHKSHSSGVSDALPQICRCRMAHWVSRGQSLHLGHLRPLCCPHSKNHFITVRKPHGWKA